MGSSSVGGSNSNTPPLSQSLDGAIHLEKKALSKLEGDSFKSKVKREALGRAIHLGSAVTKGAASITSLGASTLLGFVSLATSQFNNKYSEKIVKTSDEGLKKAGEGPCRVFDSIVGAIRPQSFEVDQGLPTKNQETSDDYTQRKSYKNYIPHKFAVLSRRWLNDISEDRQNPIVRLVPAVVALAGTCLSRVADVFIAAGAGTATLVTTPFTGVSDRAQVFKEASHKQADNALLHLGQLPREIFVIGRLLVGGQFGHESLPEEDKEALGIASSPEQPEVFSSNEMETNSQDVSETDDSSLQATAESYDSLNEELAIEETPPTQQAKLPLQKEIQLKIINECIEALINNKELMSEGIFRISGQEDQNSQLHNDLIKKHTPSKKKKKKISKIENYSVHTIANVLKRAIGQEGLFSTINFWNNLVQDISKELEGNEELKEYRICSSIMRKINTLPKEEKDTFIKLIHLLSLISNYSSDKEISQEEFTYYSDEATKKNKLTIRNEVGVLIEKDKETNKPLRRGNKMSAENLAIVFAPRIVKANESKAKAAIPMPTEENNNTIALLSFLIEHYDIINSFHQGDDFESNP